MNTLRDAAKAVLAEWDTYLNQYPHMDKGYMLDARETLRKALADADGMGWQPIETAPKNQSVLLYCSAAYVPIYCGMKRYGDPSEPQFNELAWRCDSSGTFASPTHWMPIPKPPR